jgi:spore germination protein GerM
VLLDVSQVDDGTATIDIAGPVDAPSGSDSRVAVAQIVLTATSIPQVHAVRLMREGESIDAPLPDGELTSAPLTADDYATYLIPPPTTTPTPTRAPASPR